MTEREDQIQEDESLQFHVLRTKAIVDPSHEQVSCPYCHSLMKYLPGFPQGHAQWICTNCAAQAFEGYGDTPSHNTDYKTLNSPNSPYQTEDNFKTIIRDLPSPDPELDDEYKQHGRIDVTTADKRRRYGMRFAYLSAQEATKQI